MKKLLSALILPVIISVIVSCKKDVSTTPSTAAVNPTLDTTLQISVYPNPSAGTFNDNNTHTIQIVDMLGQIKFKEVVGGETTVIDFLGLQSGVYFLAVTGKAKTISKKIIIQ